MIRILSVFPGLDLLGRAFEIVFGDKAEIVRGPDALWGGDIRRFHIRKGIYNGIIGGPPCQWASPATALAGKNAKRAIDLIPEYVRLIDEGQPDWLTMENIRQARFSPAIPKEWYPIKLRDWDCGGFTSRIRYFWTFPAFLEFEPQKREGKPEYSVLATSYKVRTPRRTGKDYCAHSQITMKKASELQGYPELYPVLKDFGRSATVAMLGNGVPKAMGIHIAKSILRQFYGGRLDNL